MTNNTRTGAHTSDGTPHGYTSLTPFIVVPRGAEAIRFYETVFGARTCGVTEMDGAVVHAELDFGNGRLQFGEPTPANGLVPPPAGNDACYSLAVYVPDVDAVVAPPRRGAPPCASRSSPSSPETVSAASSTRSVCAGR